MGVARQFSLLYGGTNPSGPLDYLKTEGPMFVANRTFEPYKIWLQQARAAGLEVIWYVNPVEYPCGGISGGWDPSGEEARWYGNWGHYTNVPNAWWWTGSLATSGNRVEYNAGHRMLNIRPGSPAVDYWVSYIVDFWSRWNGYFDGFFFDVCGNRLWASVWSTMANTVDAYAGDGRREAENWIRGQHDMFTRIRAALGPEPIIIGNNTWDTNNTGTTNTNAIAGAYTSMMKGGHPALNGCMFEGAGKNGGSQHPVSYVTAVVNGNATSLSPAGYTWATQANNRRRFAAISSSGSAVTELAPYTNISISLYVGAFPTAYESTNQPRPAGVVDGRVPDHYVNWLFGGGGGTVDTTPPTAPSAISATPTNQSIALSWTLPTLDDRVVVSVYRKSSPWTAGQGPSTSGAVSVATQTGSAITAGVKNYTETGVPVGTWYYKVFTQDAAGNIQTGGPTTSAQSTAAPGGGVGVFIYGPESTTESVSNTNTGTLIYGPESQVEQVVAGSAGVFVYGPGSSLAQIVAPSQRPTVLDHDFQVARGLRTGSFSRVLQGV